jgi:hypothetical protein
VVVALASLGMGSGRPPLLENSLTAPYFGLVHPLALPCQCSATALCWDAHSEVRYGTPAAWL